MGMNFDGTTHGVRRDTRSGVMEMENKMWRISIGDVPETDVTKAECWSAKVYRFGDPIPLSSILMTNFPVGSIVT